MDTRKSVKVRLVKGGLLGASGGALALLGTNPLLYGLALVMAIVEIIKVAAMRAGAKERLLKWLIPLVVTPAVAVGGAFLLLEGSSKEVLLKGIVVAVEAMGVYAGGKSVAAGILNK